MIKRPSKRSVLITLLIVFVAIQLKTTDKTPIKITPESDFLALEEAPQDVTKLIQSACYDCHSNPISLVQQCCSGKLVAGGAHQQRQIKSKFFTLGHIYTRAERLPEKQVRRAD